ncbi:MAG: glutamine-hydrolyzing carbamoyl-phosphate synthase small subunit [Myxococcota bacterium]
MSKAYLVLADGTRFEGTALGAQGQTIGEAVFTTGMTGYQEVITDPSYCSQIVTMTSPQIGNVGTNEEDDEASRPSLAGFVIHELSPVVSNWRSTSDLDAYLKRHGIVGISGIDTRTLTRKIRDEGAQMAAIGTGDAATLQDMARSAPKMTGRNLAQEVSTKESYTWSADSGPWRIDHTAPVDGVRGNESRAGARTQSSQYRVVAIDFGVKRSILRCLVDQGCEVTVVPWSTSAEEILSLSPDGVFLSNGPGDPAAVRPAVTNVQRLLGKKPIFGICLGHQILSLALGGSSSKLKFGHRGLNQPVQDVHTGTVEVTTQNHGFVVDVASLAGKCTMTHVHLNDGTCEGIEHRESGAFSVQYHPEASAGPHDSRYMFERFTNRIEKWGA